MGMGDSRGATQGGRRRNPVVPRHQDAKHRPGWRVCGSSAKSRCAG